MPLGEENATRCKIVLYHSEEGYSVSHPSLLVVRRNGHPPYPIVVSNPEQAWKMKIDSKGVLG